MRNGFTIDRRERAVAPTTIFSQPLLLFSLTYILCVRASVFGYSSTGKNMKSTLKPLPINDFELLFISHKFEKKNVSLANDQIALKSNVHVEPNDTLVLICMPIYFFAYVFFMDNQF